ncbi:MAG: carboxymuconolactone decarboxylase family protein [Terriglobales bacterium]
MTLEDGMVAALRRDYRTAPITEKEKVMVEYVVQLTRDATRITPEHHSRLRAAGYNDRARLQITLIAAWFNYINRVADALGVARGTMDEVK